MFYFVTKLECILTISLKKKISREAKKKKKFPLGLMHFNLYDTGSLLFCLLVSHNRLELLVRILHVI